MNLSPYRVHFPNGRERVIYAFSKKHAEAQAMERWGTTPARVEEIKED